MSQQNDDASTGPILTKYTIDPFTTGNAYKAAWTASQAAAGATSASPARPLSIKGFTIQLSDMIDLINEIRSYNDPTAVPLPNTPNDPGNATSPQLNAIRFYLGMKDNPNPTLNPDTPQIPCLVFVPVSGFAKGALPDGSRPAMPPVGGSDKVTFDSLSGSKISACYDFTFPCPGTCDIKG